MKIHALLSFYDESPSFLAAAVASIAPYVDHVIAIDGAYSLYPDATARSDRLQTETVQAVCDANNVACTIHQPQTVWYGNEVEKRNQLFKIASAFAEPFVDWYWIIDADCIVSNAPDNLRDMLANLEEWSVDVVLWERRDYIGDVPDAARVILLPTIGEQSLTCMYRVLRDMQVVGTHYVYGGFRPDGEWVYAWAPHIMGPQESVLVPEIRVEHRSIYRDKYRREVAQTYYKTRDSLGIERVAPRGSSEELEAIKVKRS